MGNHDTPRLGGADRTTRKGVKKWRKTKAKNALGVKVRIPTRKTAFGIVTIARKSSKVKNKARHSRSR